MWALVLVIMLDGGTNTQMNLGIYPTSGECIIAGLAASKKWNYPSVKLQCVRPPPEGKLYE